MKHGQVYCIPGGARGARNVHWLPRETFSIPTPDNIEWHTQRRFSNCLWGRVFGAQTCAEWALPTIHDLRITSDYTNHLNNHRNTS